MNRSVDPISRLCGYEVNHTRTSKLLRLASPVICYQQRPVVLHQSLLQLVLRIFIHIFLVVCHNALCDGLTYSVDLRCMTTTIYTYADVDIGEFVQADYEEGFVDLSHGSALLAGSCWLGEWSR